MSLEQIEKGGYDHFMLKEIHEQPKAIIDTYRGRMLPEQGIIKMSGVDDQSCEIFKCRSNHHYCLWYFLARRISWQNIFLRIWQEFL